MQGSDAWLNFRHKHIGASDAPVVMGVSPWKTAYALWHEKIQPYQPPNFTNPAMEKGSRLEPKIRAIYELQTGREAPPAVVEYAELPFLSASLDGYNEADNFIVEIKYVGVDMWRAIDGKKRVPAHYAPQVQMQLLVTGAKACDFVAYNDDIDKITIVEVKPDLEYIKIMVGELKRFWECVKKKTAPPLSDRDYKTVNDPGLRELIKEWKFENDKMQIAKTNADLLRGQIIENAIHPRMKYKDVKIYKTERKGAVNYKKIPQLEGVDLNEHRSKTVTSWTFKVNMPDKDA